MIVIINRLACITLMLVIVSCVGVQGKEHVVDLLDLVEVIKVNPRIKLDIRYATENNFTKKIVYSSARCFLRKATMDKLSKVQEELELQGLGLKVFDGYRPRSVQYKFWELCPNRLYVADPKKGSIHNRGTAVDLTLINLKTGVEFEMPSAFDDFSERAHREYEKMTPVVAKNCKLLEDVMVKHGFTPKPWEWWHFDDADWQKYDLLDVPFEAIRG